MLPAYFFSIVKYVSLPNGDTIYNKNAGQRAETYNALLCEAGKAGRLVETKLKTKARKKPWVAAKNTFRDLYKCL
mgnify:CR=1 FL=1